MSHNTSLLHRHPKSSSFILAVGLTGLLLLTGWISVQARQGRALPEPLSATQYSTTALPFPAFPRSAPTTDTISATLYLPMVAQTFAQSVTIMAPQPAWTAAWWQWIESIYSAPLFGHDQVDCGLGQSGNVWFLAGTDGYSPATRICKVPPNKTLVVPLHTVAWANEGAENLTVEEKRAVLDAVYSDAQPGILDIQVCHLESTIDGEAVNYARVQSPTFLYKTDPDAVADGFWFAFHLTGGVHAVKFRGALCLFGTDTPVNDVDVTYTLEVDPAEAEPGARWQLFVWNTQINPFATGCSPTDPSGVTPCSSVDLGRNSIYVSAPPWRYTAPEAGAVLTVVDTVPSGEEFEIFDNDVSIGRTSPARDDDYCPVPAGGDPGVCLRRNGMSSGTFVLSPGDHAITIQPQHGHYLGVGYFRLEPTSILAQE